MKERRHREGGFTLLELLMVVIIIAILASIALPQYLRVAERSRGAEALAVLAAIRSAELRYKAQDPAGNYTTNLNQLDTDIPGFGGVPLGQWNFNVNGTGNGSNATAQRVAFTGKTISIDLDSGNVCSSLGNVYGVNNGTC